MENKLNGHREEEMPQVTWELHCLACGSRMSILNLQGRDLTMRTSCPYCNALYIVKASYGGYYRVERIS